MIRCDFGALDHHRPNALFVMRLCGIRLLIRRPLSKPLCSVWTLENAEGKKRGRLRRKEIDIITYILCFK